VSAVAPRGTTAPIRLDRQPKTFGLFSMTLFAVSAMLVLDSRDLRRRRCPGLA
jgi:hypothetical protein